MPAITTFGGAAVRSLGRGIDQASAELPANTVLFYNITNSTTQTISSLTTGVTTPQYSTTFDGNGDYLRIASNTALALGAGDFTFEMWVYNNVVSIPAETSLYDQRNGQNGLAVLQPYVDLTSTDGYGWYTAATYKIKSGVSAVKLNQWQHIAVCRISGYLRMYVDGILVGTPVFDDTVYPAGSLHIGRSNDNATTRYFTGYITDLRVVVGSSLYNGNAITLPTSQLTSVTGTKLLTGGSSSIIDSSPIGLTISIFGNVQQISAGPYSWWTLLDTGSKYITGTTTQADIGTSSATASGTATLVGSTGTSGAHSGGTTFTTPPYGGATDIYSSYAATAGNHTHALTTADLSTALANTVAITTVTNPQKRSLIPANCIVFRKVAPTSLNFTAVTYSGAGYFYGRSSAANTTWTDCTAIGGCVATAVGTGGLHSHVQASNYYNWGGTFSSNLSTSSGSHTDHGLTINVEVRLASRYMKAWVSSVDEPVEYGMIVMYRGDLSKLPAGWRLCDGTLGTDNMNNYALHWASTGTHGQVVYSTGAAVVPSTQTGMTTTSSWNHTHVGASSTIRGSSGWHQSFNASHAHTFSVTGISSSSYSQPYYKLAFIQYKGI